MSGDAESRKNHPARFCPGIRRLRKGAALKDKLHRGLHQSRSRRTHHFSKRRAINVAVHRGWPVELRVVEYIEPLKAKL
jgi:hypothetical protein